MCCDSFLTFENMMFRFTVLSAVLGICFSQNFTGNGTTTGFPTHFNGTTTYPLHNFNGTHDFDGTPSPLPNISNMTTSFWYSTTPPVNFTHTQWSTTAFPWINSTFDDIFDGAYNESIDTNVPRPEPGQIMADAEFEELRNFFNEIPPQVTESFSVIGADPRAKALADQTDMFVQQLEMLREEHGYLIGQYPEESRVIVQFMMKALHERDVPQAVKEYFQIALMTLPRDTVREMKMQMGEPILELLAPKPPKNGKPGKKGKKNRKRRN